MSEHSAEKDPVEELAEVLCPEPHRETVGYVSSLTDRHGQPVTVSGPPTWRRVPCPQHRADARRLLAAGFTYVFPSDGGSDD